MRGCWYERGRGRTSGAVLLPLLRGPGSAAGRGDRWRLGVRLLRAGFRAAVHRDRADKAGHAMSPVLLAVAHGSRDAAAKECVLSLTRRVARVARGTRVGAAFVQHERPSLVTALDCAVTEAGADGAVVVPLLLSTG